MSATKQIVAECLWGSAPISIPNGSPLPPHTPAIRNGGINSMPRAGQITTHHSENITQTSLMSFIQLKDEGMLGERQALVFKQISLHPGCTDRELSEYCNLPINCITARRNELAKFGMIKCDGVKHDDVTNRMVQRWVVI